MRFFRRVSRTAPKQVRLRSSTAQRGYFLRRRREGLSPRGGREPAADSRAAPGRGGGAGQHVRRLLRAPGTRPQAAALDQCPGRHRPGAPAIGRGTRPPVPAGRQACPPAPGGMGAPPPLTPRQRPRKPNGRHVVKGDGRQAGHATRRPRRTLHSVRQLAAPHRPGTTPYRRISRASWPAGSRNVTGSSSLGAPDRRFGCAIAGPVVRLSARGLSALILPAVRQGKGPCGLSVPAGGASFVWRAGLS
jgi:hypothetical protein